MKGTNKRLKKLEHILFILIIQVFIEHWQRRRRLNWAFN
jgi:hypothetical protein